LHLRARLAAPPRPPPPRLGAAARAAVAALDRAVDGPDLGDRGLTPRLPGAGRPPSPLVVAAGRHAQDLTHQPDRPGITVGLDELVSHDDSLAKKAVAFFLGRQSLFDQRFFDLPHIGPRILPE